MTGRHRSARHNDMPPDPLRGGVRHGTTAAVSAIVNRWETRATAVNETGKLEWVYLPGVRHGAHDATPTIAEIARDEPCEKTTGWPAISCATMPPLRVTGEDWASSYCLPCLIRAALDREEHRPVPNPFMPWPDAAVAVIIDWLLTKPKRARQLRSGEWVELVNTPDAAVREPVVQFRMHHRWGTREFDEWLPYAVHRKAHYIATGVWL